MTKLYWQPYDALTVNGRPAIFLHWMFKGRDYARIRFVDTGERVTINRIDFDTPAAIPSFPSRFDFWTDHDGVTRRF